MIKMSEFSPRSTVVLRDMLAEIFPEDQVAVFGGGVDIAQAFASLPLDHIVFTGSPAVGKEIMRAAAANLTPVTLELGGKSPAIVARSASIAAAARSIAHGKAFNAGQACVAPDYALVPSEHIDEFVAAAVSAFQRMYPDPVNDPNYTSIASDRHADRARELLADAVAKGAKVTSCGPGDGRRIITMQVVTGVTRTCASCRKSSSIRYCPSWLATRWTKAFDTSPPGLVRLPYITLVRTPMKCND